MGSGPFSIGDGAANDLLQIPGGGASPNSTVNFSRLSAGSSARNRQVQATVVGGATNAVITIDVTDCQPRSGGQLTVGYWNGTNWINVGGTLGTSTSGKSIITTPPLPHLSIYAVATT